MPVTPHPVRTRRWWATPPARAYGLGLVAAAGLLPVYLSTLAPGLTWANASADGGDLITAAATFGVAHPTGYPTYLLLARAAQYALGGSSLAWRTNVLSAVCAALAAGLLVPLVAQAHAGRARFGLAGGVLAAAAFGLSPMLWSQAVVTEVYTLHALFIAVILLGLPLGRPAAAQSPWAARLAGLLFGLALGNHVTTALLLPPWLLLAARQRGQPTFVPLVNRLAGLAVGLLVYLYLPWRAAGHPPVNWGGASTLEGLWWVISGLPYRDMAFALPSEFVLGRVQGWAGLVLAQFGWLGLVAAAFGLFFGAAARRVRGLTGWLVLVYSAFAIGYNTADSLAYLLPAFLALAVWLGLGAATALEGLPAPAPRRRWLRPALACLLGATLCLNAARQLPGLDASRDQAAEAFGRAALAAAPPQALLLTHADRDTFALWYFHFALKQRPDVAVVVEPLLGHAWYRDSLARTYPTLVVPTTGAGDWRAALLAANDRPACDTPPTGEAAAPLVCGESP